MEEKRNHCPKWRWVLGICADRLGCGTPTRDKSRSPGLLRPAHLQLSPELMDASGVFSEQNWKITAALVF